MGLERVSRCCASRCAETCAVCFTVAGTNGKGTTCRTLEAVLMAAGYKVGVYSSPPVRYTERVRVQNSELPESAHTASFAEIEAARGEISLTYFEYGTLSALWLFKQAQLDVVILEVGLGGRLDATNMVDADVAVVTSIARIIPTGSAPIAKVLAVRRPVFSARISPRWLASRICRTPLPTWRKRRALTCCAGVWTGSMRFRTTAGAIAMRRERWRICPCRRYRNLMPPPPAALRASGLAVSEQAIRDGIQNAILPGRFQIVSDAPRLILDVAHNPHAAAYLAARLKSLPKPGACWRLSVCFMIKISAVRWPAWRVWSIAGIVLLWRGRAVRRLSSCWNISAKAQSTIAWLRPASCDGGC